jgi:hypothetical protein
LLCKLCKIKREICFALDRRRQERAFTIAALLSHGEPFAAKLVVSKPKFAAKMLPYVCAPLGFLFDQNISLRVHCITSTGESYIVATNEGTCSGEFLRFSWPQERDVQTSMWMVKIKHSFENVWL